MSGTPFKMKGFSGFGNSPVKQKTQVIAPKNLYGKESILKSHPFTPPETPRKDTLKGQTGFESDFPITSKIFKYTNPFSTTKRNIKNIKIIGEDIVRKGKQVYKYFTER